MNPGRKNQGIHNWWRGFQLSLVIMIFTIPVLYNYKLRLSVCCLPVAKRWRRKFLILTFIVRRYMAEILPIRRKTLSNQSINQSINQYFYSFHPDLCIMRFYMLLFPLITCITKSWLQLYGGIRLPPTCSINDVNILHNYADMYHYYVNLRDK